MPKIIRPIQCIAWPYQNKCKLMPMSFCMRYVLSNSVHGHKGKTSAFIMKSARLVNFKCKVDQTCVFVTHNLFQCVRLHLHGWPIPKLKYCHFSVRMRCGIHTELWQQGNQLPRHFAFFCFFSVDILPKNVYQQICRLHHLSKIFLCSIFRLLAVH